MAVLVEIAMVNVADVEDVGDIIAAVIAIATEVAINLVIM